MDKQAGGLVGKRERGNLHVQSERLDADQLCSDGAIEFADQLL
jgi:hypothetical protein